ncbi:MAG: integration host factor subunit beta [Gallionella sp.]|jgi:integration host factor subunit beta|nr:integration host factor subunit beta [Gallionella sp.]
MNRSDLIDALATTQPHLKKADVEECAKTILDTIVVSLCKGRRVEIRGFGSFQVNQRSARSGRNPKTGEPVEVPAKVCPHFKPGKELRDRVDG